MRRSASENLEIGFHSGLLLMSPMRSCMEAMTWDSCHLSDVLLHMDTALGETLHLSRTQQLIISCWHMLQQQDCTRKSIRYQLKFSILSILFVVYQSVNIVNICYTSEIKTQNFAPKSQNFLLVSNYLIKYLTSHSNAESTKEFICEGNVNGFQSTCYDVGQTTWTDRAQHKYARICSSNRYKRRCNRNSKGLCVQLWLVNNKSQN